MSRLNTLAIAEAISDRLDDDYDLSATASLSATGRVVLLVTELEPERTFRFIGEEVAA